MFYLMFMLASFEVADKCKGKRRLKHACTESADSFVVFWLVVAAELLSMKHSSI